jgi:hypothetical protein
MMGDSDMFTKPMMTKWMSKQPAQRTYAHSVLIFKVKAEVLGKYKAGSDGRKKNPFSVAAGGTENQGQLEEIVKIILSKFGERALAAQEEKSEVAELKIKIQTLTSMVRRLTAAIELRPAKRPW